MTKGGQVHEFDWDKGNLDKSYQKHGVTPNEAEEIFLDDQLLVVPDVCHGGNEERWMAIGSTFTGEVLFCVFTMRGRKIRIISVRPANRKERGLYASKDIKKDTQV